MTGFKTILIDPFTRTVSEVEYNGQYKHIYDLIQCDTYDAARINQHGDAIFVDDEGLFKEEQAFFWHEDYPQPLAGRGLLLGCRATDGETIAPTTTLEEVRSKVQFGQPVRLNGRMVWMGDDATFRPFE